MYLSHIYIYIYIYTGCWWSARPGRQTRQAAAGGGSGVNVFCIFLQTPVFQGIATVVAPTSESGECLLYISSDSSFPRYCHGCCSDLGLAHLLPTKSMGTRQATPTKQTKQTWQAVCECCHARVILQFKQPTFQKVTNNHWLPYSHFKCVPLLQVFLGWNAGCWKYYC